MEVGVGITGQLDDSQRVGLKSMLDVVINCKAINLPAKLQCQQKGGPDLTEDELRKVVEELLFERPAEFLTRFGYLLREEHFDVMRLFKNGRNNCYIEYFLTQLKAQLTDSVRRRLIKNRRFEALKRLEREGKYFSEEEMKGREPLLYHQLIGQFLSEQEKIEKYKAANKEELPSFSKFLMTHAEEMAIETRMREQIADEAGEEDASSDEDPPRAGTSTDPPKTSWGADWEDEEREKKRKQQRKKMKVERQIITAEEKELLLDEFKTHMHTKFLGGRDADFDYSLVDENPEYDCIQVRGQDEEEKYFDEETSDNAGAMCTDTGIEDY